MQALTLKIIHLTLKNKSGVGEGEGGELYYPCFPAKRTDSGRLQDGPKVTQPETGRDTAPKSPEQRLTALHYPPPGPRFH